jgi:phosphate/sulfate permease
MTFWEAAYSLPALPLLALAFALFVAFGFEFINGFHDTANAVTTVIYTHTLRPTPAVLFSGFMNLLGALVTLFVGTAAVAFSIVNLLPVDLLIDSNSSAALVMVLSLLIAGVLWNLGTWYLGLPVSSSHTLIGAILGVGIANSLWNQAGLSGVNWTKAGEVGLGLLLSPLVGFIAAGALLLLMKRAIREPRLFEPPQDGYEPPRWVRGVLIVTCGAVSFAHGSNDGQKGMGLLLLVLIGFLPAHYALSVNRPELAVEVREAASEIRAVYEDQEVPIPDELARDLAMLQTALAGKASFDELAGNKETRWQVRQAILRTKRAVQSAEGTPNLPAGMGQRLKEIRTKKLAPAIEFVPVWVVVCTAFAIGIGTCVGYKRIVVTVAEKIGKTHLTYAQGAAAEAVTAVTILLADGAKLPVSTTQVLASGVAGTMAANGSGVQLATCRRILLAWILTLPACVLLAGVLFTLGRTFVM